jgi:hypothetical protein
MDKFLLGLGVMAMLMFLGMSLAVYETRLDNKECRATLDEHEQIYKNHSLELDRVSSEIDENFTDLDTRLLAEVERVSILDESVSSKSKRWARIKKTREAIEATTREPPPILKLTTMAAAAVDYSDEYDVPLALVLGVMRQESNFQERVVSHANAHGLMQVLPETAKEIAGDVRKRHYNLFNIKNNVQFGTYYLRKMLDTFDGREELAIRAYNCGPICVSRVVSGEWGKFTCGDEIEDYPCETADYLIRVQKWKKEYEDMGL